MNRFGRLTYQCQSNSKEITASQNQLEIEMRNIRVVTIFQCICFSLCLITSVALAQSEPYPITQEIKQLVINRAASIFQERHVIPEIGEEYAIALRQNLASGTFDEVTTGREFMIAMDRILWPIDTDGHVWINFYSADIPADYSGDFENVPPEQTAEAETLAKRRNFGFEKVERLRGNIGYIDYRAFTDGNGSKDALAAAMTFVQHTGALIIDLRQNGGGSPEIVTEFLSYFLEPANALISTFVDRVGAVTGEYRVSDELLGPMYGETRPVFVLNSRNTYSGAEAFGYTLQVRDRARIVGEKTRGGARPNYTYRVHPRFMVAVPVWQSVDSVTNSNYEETGIIPDYEMPSEESFSFAYRTALEELIANAVDEPAKREMESVLRELSGSQEN
jgi:hypothetical protein